MNGEERRFVNLPVSEAYQDVLHIMRTRIKGLGTIEKEIEPPRVKTVVDHLVRVDIRFLSENGACTAVLNFSLKRAYILTLILFIVIIALAIITQKEASTVGILFILPILLGAQYRKENFMKIVYRGLSELEREYSQRITDQERARFQGITMDIGELRKRLEESYTQRWGNAHVLDYKINEYTRQGLTYREALLKIADKEGFLRNEKA